MADYFNGRFGYLIALESFDFLLDMAESAIKTRSGVDSLVEAKFAILAVSTAIAGAIREAGSIPSGHVYAALCGKMSLQSYESCIDLLCRINLIERSPDHLLTWKGPKA